MRIWDPRTGQAGHTLTGHTDRVSALAVAPDGSWLASAGGGGFGVGDATVRIWDVEGRGCVAALRTGHALYQVLAAGA